MNVNDLLSLKGKIALITGGSGIFGKHMFEGLAEAGATVITASPLTKEEHEAADALRAKGHDTHAMTVDQTDHESIMAMKDAIKKQFGRLDVFVNNAVARPMKKYRDPIEAWAESMRVNATGMFDIMREMADFIAEGGGGTIVNIGSMQGLFGADFSLYEGTDMDSVPDYHFHKGGIVSLTKYLARRLAPQNIRVNCINPGGIFANQPEPFLSRYNKKVPLGRMANGDDIKGVVVFFASEASSYVTGENLLMDGGLHA